MAAVAAGNPLTDNGANGAMPAMMTVSDLRFRYAGSAESRTWTVDGVSFTLQRGEILGIVGPNGSGKSSLLKLMARLLTPSAGSIALEGRPLHSWTPRDVARVLAFVPQESIQTFPFTVAETVLMGRYAHQPPSSWTFGLGGHSAADVAHAAQAMVETGVADLAARPVSEVSGGERQRVMIARALTQEPRLLCLDEPTASLDINHQLELCTLLARLRIERQLTVVMVSHDLNLASHYCDRLLLLHAGKAVRLGTPDAIMQPELLREVYGCEVLVDRHPQSGRPRLTLPSSSLSSAVSGRSPSPAPPSC